MSSKLLFLDVDGTLTDGKINIGFNGEIYKSFNVKDGFGLKKAIQNNIVPIIITGRESKIVEFRCKELGITEIYQNVSNKKEKIEEIVKQKNIALNNTIFIGDDENDLEAIRICGFSFAPNDAVAAVKDSVDIVLAKNGGEGCVREAIDYLLKNNFTNTFIYDFDKKQIVS